MLLVFIRNVSEGHKYTDDFFFIIIIMYLNGLSLPAVLHFHSHLPHLPLFNKHSETFQIVFQVPVNIILHRNSETLPFKPFCFSYRALKYSP